MKKYVLWFAGAYFVLMVVATSLLGILNVDASGFVELVCVMGASFLAADRFTRDYRRTPHHQEIRAYAWGALLGSGLISALLTLFFWRASVSVGEEDALFASLRGVNPALLVGALLLAALIDYCAIRWAFGWYAKKNLAQQGRPA